NPNLSGIILQVFYGNGYRVHYNIGYAKIPTAHGNDIAGTLAIIAAILCHYDGTALPHGWHSVATVMARPCQRR
ncbi:hypothetical protein, partial [Parabacteroides distasonis]